jgi:zinc protease
MRPYSLALSLPIFFLLLACSTASRTSNSIDDRNVKFEIRKFETQVLANGLNVIWIPDNTLPYISMQVMIKSGSSQDPIGKEGLASFSGQMLSKGTVKRTANKISDDLEQIGTGFSVEVQPDYSLASTSALSFHRDNILKQFTEILMTPTFPVREIERQRKLTLGAFRKMADSPEDFAESLMPRFVFGDHPYGHEPSGTAKSIGKLTRADLLKFYRENFNPGNAVVAIVGQYDEAWKKKAIDELSAWKSVPTNLREVPAFPDWSGAQLMLVDRSDLKQAQVQIAFRGVPRNIEEFLEVRAAIKLLGESQGSRLFEEIREKRGLTYNISAWFAPRVQAGPMGIYTSTRLDKVAEIITETLNVYRNFVANGVTEAEVKDVKAMMRGQFPRTFETPEALATQLLFLNRYGIGVEYLSGYFTNLDRISKSSIDSAIRKYFDSNNLKILVHAPKESALEAMKKVGAVEVRRYETFLN